MKFDISAESAKYRAEMAEIDKRNRERWQAFAERIRTNPNPGHAVKKGEKV